MPIVQSHLRPVTPSDGNGGETASRQKPRQHPAKALPSDRMKMDKQIAVLQAIGRHSSPRRHVDAEDLSRAVTGIAPTTVMLSNRFFEAAGWITVPDKGRYAATDALVEYVRKLAAGTSDPAQALRETARHSWFWEILEPDLADGQRLNVHDAHVKLMSAADAGDGHLPNIRNLISWLEHVGMVTVRDQVIVASTAMTGNVTEPEPPPPGDQGAEERQDAGHGSGASRGGEPPTPVVVAFSVDLKVTAADIARLSPDQIKALFEAVGTVMAIKQQA